jgi:DNA sulfur modification protein DndB
VDMQAAALDADGEEARAAIREVLKQLLARKIIVFRRFSGEYKMWEGSDFDFEGALAQAQEDIWANFYLSGDDEVCVIFVAGVTSQHQDDDPGGYERTRRPFTTLNRYAKPVSKRDIIALDEDNVMAILTRQFVEDHALFHDKVSTGRTRSISVTDKASWRRFKAIRPPDEVIATFYKRAAEFWNMMMEHFPPLQELKNSKPTEEIAGKYRHMQGGHLLFRPIGLLIIVQVLRYLMESGMQLAEAIRVVSQVPMEVSAPPWIGLMWDTVNKRMITTQENRKVAERLLFYSVGGDFRRLRANSHGLRQEHAGILSRVPIEVELPRYSS